MADCYLIKQGSSGGGGGGRPQWSPAIWPLDAQGYPVGDVTIDNGITSLRQYIFSNNISYTGINSLNCPESLENIRDYTFQNTNFTNPINLNKVNYIGQYAFSSSSISNIQFNLESEKTSYTFGPWSFYNQYNLKNYIDIPYNCNSIYLYNQAFQISNFLGFNFLNKINNISLSGSYIFANSKITDNFINSFSNNVNSIIYTGSTDYMFAYCSNLNNIYCKFLSSFAFMGCSQLKHVTIAEDSYGIGVTNIFSQTFKDCQNLKQIDFLNGNNLKNYGISFYSTFQNCLNLEYINNIPNNISMISELAFDNCRALKNIYFSNSSINYIGACAFQNCRNINIIFNNFQNSNIFLNHSCFQYCNLTENCLNFIFNSMRNCPNTIFQHNIFSYSFGYEYVFPSQLQSNMFSNVYDLKEVIVYDYNNYPKEDIIGENCLSNCINLIKVDFLNSHQKSIFNHNSYQNCHKLEKIYVNGNSLSGTNAIAVSIYNNCFRNCYSLRYLDFSRSISTNTSGQIYRNTFENCFQLIQLALPYCIRSINTYAFYNCYSLKDVFFNSTVQISGTFSAPQSFNIYNRNNCSTITYNMDLKQNNITVKINNEQRDLNELPYIIKYNLNNAEDKTTERIIQCAAYQPNHLPAYTNISIPSIGTHEFANFDFSSSETDGYRINFEMVNNIYPDKIYIGYENIEFEDIYTMLVPQNAKVKYRLIKSNYLDLEGEIDVTENNMTIPLSMQEAIIFNYSFGSGASLTLDEQIDLFENDELISVFKNNNWTIESNPESQLPGEIKCDQTLPLNGATYATLKIKFPNTFGETLSYGRIHMILKHYGTYGYDWSFVYISERKFVLPSYSQVQNGTILGAGDYYFWRENNPNSISYNMQKDVTLNGDTLYITFGYIRGSNQSASYPIHQMGIQKLDFYALKDEPKGE